MDGFQTRLKTSLQFRLALGLSMAVLLVAVVSGAFSFRSALAEANELQDNTLHQVAALVAQQPAGSLVLSATGPDADPESRLIVQQLGPAAAGALALPESLVDGLQRVVVGGVAYRVMVRTLAGGGRVAVAQETRVRDEIAQDSALRTVVPLLILVPTLLLVLIELVRRMFRPVTRLAADIDGRGKHELHAVSARHLPSEIQPFVRAINSLLGRVEESMATQRRFVANAAHELRSPMTALSLQAERLAATDMPAEARARLGTLRHGIERGRKLLDQLLGLARAQASPARPIERVAVEPVYRSVLEDLMPLAQAKNIDLGMDAKGDAQVLAQEGDLAMLLRNLVDNAIRYTPQGGRVDLRLSEVEAEIRLEVEDSGPGIPANERLRVLDPFYRALGTAQPGSGLGLAIVQVTVQRLGGRMVLGEARLFDSGLNVSIWLPKAGTGLEASATGSTQTAG